MTATMNASFASTIWYWRGPSPYFFVTVPAEQSRDIKSVSKSVSYGWGMVPVHATIGRTRWKTSLFPKDGGYVLPLKDSVRTAEDLHDGDEISVQLEVRL